MSDFVPENAPGIDLTGLPAEQAYRLGQMVAHLTAAARARGRAETENVIRAALKQVGTIQSHVANTVTIPALRTPAHPNHQAYAYALLTKLADHLRAADE